MKRFLVLSIASMIMIFTCAASAEVAWEESFDPIKATWVQTSATWTDLAGPTAKLTESDPVQTYGVAISETITADVSTYRELVITSTQIDSGALYTVQIYDACDPNIHANAISYMGTPGTQVIDIANLMGWSGTKSFAISIWIDGDNKGVTFDDIQVRSSVGWLEDFDPIKTTWVQTTATWTDLAGATAKLTESDPAQNYGFAQSEIITVDVNTYSEIVIVSTAVDTDSAYKVQIQEIGGTSAFADAVQINLPGTQIIDIAKLMGWSGTKSFVINIWIEGEGKSVTFDSLQIRKAVVGQDAWLENFNPIKTTWTEETCYWTDTAGQGAVLTENNIAGRPTQWYGVVDSEVLTLDVNVYHSLYIETTAVDPYCLYSVQVQEVSPDPNHYAEVISQIGHPSEHTVDIAAMTGWTGTKTFWIRIWISSRPGYSGQTVTFNKIELSSGDVEQPKPIFWQDHFNPLRSDWYEYDRGAYLGAYWTDNPDSTATLTEDFSGGAYGKVESETFTVDLDVYPELTVVVNAIDGGGAWLDVAIQEEGGTWAPYDIITNITAPGTYQANIADIVGWSGYKNFRIVLWINGNNMSATLDQIKLAIECGPDVLSGDYYQDCVVDFYDLVYIGDSWMNEYNMLDLKDISDNWLEKTY